MLEKKFKQTSTNFSPYAGCDRFSTIEFKKDVPSVKSINETKGKRSREKLPSKDNPFLSKNLIEI